MVWAPPSSVAGWNVHLLVRLYICTIHCQRASYCKYFSSANNWKFLASSVKSISRHEPWCMRSPRHPQQGQTRTYQFCKHSSMLKLTDGLCMQPQRYKFQLVRNESPSHEVRHLGHIIWASHWQHLLMHCFCLFWWQLDYELFYNYGNVDASAAVAEYVYSGIPFGSHYSSITKLRLWSWEKVVVCCCLVYNELYSVHYKQSEKYRHKHFTDRDNHLVSQMMVPLAEE